MVYILTVFMHVLSINMHINHMLTVWCFPHCVMVFLLKESTQKSYVDLMVYVLRVFIPF